MVLLWMALSVKATAQMGAGGLLPGYIRGTGFPERYHPVPIPGETDGERRLHWSCLFLNQLHGRTSYFADGNLSQCIWRTELLWDLYQRKTVWYIYIYMKDGESFVIPWCVGNNHGVVVKPQQTYRAVIPLHRWQSAQPFQLVSMSHILYTWKRLSRVNRVERILHLE